jgi:hypothetical protein
VVLLPSRDDALRRFRERTAAAVEPADVHAGQVIERAGGAAQLSAMYDRLLDVVAARPATRVVPVTGNRPEETYPTLLAALH